jgi:hypothetical protein
MPRHHQLPHDEGRNTIKRIKKHRFNEALSVDEEPSLMVGAESRVQTILPGHGT